MKFKVGETYFTANGSEVVIVADNSPYKYSGKTPCPLIGVVKGKSQTTFSTLYPFDTEGRYCGITALTGSYVAYNLISDEPTSEEQELIALLKGIPSTDERDRDEALLKAIRQLRKK